MFQMFRRLWLTYLTLSRTFGIWFVGAFILFVYMNLWMINRIGCLLDWVFFPKLWSTKIRAPIVIVGNPRTGTTFLQRFMADQNLGAGMQVWRMVYASLTIQTILKPFLPRLEAVSPVKFHQEGVHKTGLTSVETDDPALFSRFFDGYFLYGFFLAWADREYIHEFDPQKRDTARRDFNWFGQLWRRNLVATGKDRVLAKVFSLGLRIPAFLNQYPDARILYMVRDPMAVVPSGMSLVTGVLDRALGFWKLPESARRRFLDRLYFAFLELSRRFHDDYTSGRIPADRIYIVKYDRMMADFETVMDEILDFIDVAPSEELRAEIKRTAAKQAAWKSEHKYDLAKYGFTAEQIRKDYAFLYQTFGISDAG